MGGKETIGEIRKMNPETPVFVTSGYAEALYESVAGTWATLRHYNANYIKTVYNVNYIFVTL
jgi:hypothetical protein